MQVIPNYAIGYKIIDIMVSHTKPTYFFEVVNNNRWLIVITVKYGTLERLSFRISYVTEFDKTRLPHTFTFMTLKHHNLMLEYALVSNFDFVFYNAIMKNCVKILGQ